MAMYYLEDPDAVLLPRSGFSRSDMREFVPRPAWLVISVYEPSAGDRSRQVEAAGRLQAYFANRIAEPNHTINIYYYTPPDIGGGSLAIPERSGYAATARRGSSRLFDARNLSGGGPRSAPA